MQTLQQPFSPSYSSVTRRSNIATQFFAWCKKQEPYRYGWLAVIITLHGCVLTPLTVLLITMSGNNMALWGLAMGSMAMCLTTNLAAMPTKVTIPVFFLSVIIDLLVVAISLNLIFS